MALRHHLLAGLEVREKWNMQKPSKMCWSSRTLVAVACACCCRAVGEGGYILFLAGRRTVLGAHYQPQSPRALAPEPQSPSLRAPHSRQTLKPKNGDGDLDSSKNLLEGVPSIVKTNGCIIILHSVPVRARRPRRKKRCGLWLYIFSECIGRCHSVCGTY